MKTEKLMLFERVLLSLIDRIVGKLQADDEVFEDFNITSEFDEQFDEFNL